MELWISHHSDLSFVDYFAYNYVKFAKYVGKPDTLRQLEDNIWRVCSDI